MTTPRKLTKEEYKTLNSASEDDLAALSKIDISLLDSDGESFVELVLQKKRFDKLQYFLHCINVDKEIIRLIKQNSEYETAYFDFILSLQNKQDYERALNILNQSNYPWHAVKFSEIFNGIYTHIKDRNYQRLASLLQYREIHSKLREVRTDDDELTRTPLEYAHKRNDVAACNMILSTLAKDNPFAKAVQDNELKTLQKLVKDLKPPVDTATQEKLQIAGICFQLMKFPPQFGEVLLEAGLQIYPVNPYYRASVLHGVLSFAENHPDEPKRQLPFVKACLEALKKQKPQESAAAQEALLECFNGKNLLELAINTQNVEIIQLMQEAGAKLPQMTEAGVAVRQRTPVVAPSALLNPLLLAVKQDNLLYFKSNITKSTPEQLQEVAIYCVENYSNRLIPFLSALLNNQQAKAIIISKPGKSLMDLALELNKMPLIVFLVSCGFKLPSHIEEKQQKNHTTIDQLAELVKSGKKAQLENLIPYCQPLLRKRSLEGLTLTETAAIYEQYDIVAMLVNREDFDVSLDSTFNILDKNVIKDLRAKYNDSSHINLTHLLNKVLEIQSTSTFSILSLFQKDSIIAPIIYDVNTLALVVTSIANGQLGTDTVNKLAKKDGFKEKVIHYMQQLSKNKEGEFLYLLSNENNNKSFAKFFAVPRRLSTPVVVRGALGEFSKLLNVYHSKKEKVKVPESSFVEEVVEQAETEGVYNPTGQREADPYAVQGVAVNASTLHAPTAPPLDYANASWVETNPLTDTDNHLVKPNPLTDVDRHLVKLNPLPTTDNPVSDASLLPSAVSTDSVIEPGSTAVSGIFKGENANVKKTEDRSTDESRKKMKPEPHTNKIVVL